MSIRIRLTLWFIVVIVMANALLSLVTVLRVGHAQLQEVQTRVRFDLNSAREVYGNHIESIAQYLRAAALNDSLGGAVAGRDRGALARLLGPVYREGEMDILLAVDSEGRVLYRGRNPESFGDDRSTNPLIARALSDHRLTSGTVIVPQAALEREGADLAERAFFEIRETQAARPTTDKVRADGMVVGAAVPIFDRDGRFLGVLYGADLLNRRYEIVDRIRDEVFKSQLYDGKPIGTATIFQGDLRVSTNVMTADGQRAVGTRLSDRVSARVLDEGMLYADEAFVVNDWYITAYEPIRDPMGSVIGVLYVGLLKNAFTRPQRAILNVVLPVMAITTLASLILLFFVTRHILWPIDRIVEMTGKVVDGDLSARVSIRPPGEMGRLSAAIDSMAEAVAEREERLKQTTREQIGQSEKLASIGRLAAGVAHEINNPLTGVLTFSSLLRQKPNMDAQDLQDLDVIVRETTRVREIVRGLLDFARESPSARNPIDINEVIRNTLRLVRSQKEFRNITIHEYLGEELSLVRGDKNQLQQVLLNLSLNACEAMDGGGTLAISTLHRDNRVAIIVHDTGHGIAKEHMETIFDPFFTTKPVGKGTGLGLSVSYGIIQKHEGTIEVESEVGKGTTFTITLPVADSDSAGPSNGIDINL